MFTNPNRREFLGALSAFSFLPLEHEKPDLILFNANIHTVNEKEPWAQEAGKVADLVVLGRDPMKEDPATLVTIPVERTMPGGRWTYES